MPKRNEAFDKLPAFDMRAKREEKKLTQTQCAAILCVSQGTLAKWESNGAVPQIYRSYWELYWNAMPKAAKQPKPTKGKGKGKAQPQETVN